MLRYSFKHRQPAAILLMVALVNFCLLADSTASHHATAEGEQSQAVGSLTSSGDVNVNGNKVISDTTLFPNSRIRVACGSRATARGAFGKVDFEPGTEMQMNISGGALNGELFTGRVKITVPAGIQVDIKMPVKTFSSHGNKAVVEQVLGGEKSSCQRSGSLTSLSGSALALIFTGLTGATSIALIAALDRNASRIIP